MFLSRYNPRKSRKKPKKRYQKARMVEDDTDTEAGRDNRQRLPKERTTDKQSNIINKKITKGKKIDVVDEYWQTDDLERQRYLHGKPIVDPLPEEAESNECYQLNNTPLNTQVYTGLTLAPYEALQYDSFIPTGETYEFLPCAPISPNAMGILGFKRVRGKDTIMDRYGDFKPGTSNFKPYKMLLYRGRRNDQPLTDDGHRFVYLAPSKSNEQTVGDCFIRLEEIHKRMIGDSLPYEEDYQLAIEYETLLRTMQRPKSQQEANDANFRYNFLLNECGGRLRFRCWTVAGAPSTEDENRLSEKLYRWIFYKPQEDCLEMFRVWAEILRKSQGDKLAAKDFFGRYWDAVIPLEYTNIFADGFKIIVGAEYTQSKGYLTTGSLVDPERHDMRKEVFDGVQRVIDTPRLKFKPQLSIANVFFSDEINVNGNDSAPDWFSDGWRLLELHPAGLYGIVVNLAVREFLLGAIEGKPFYQVGYEPPDEQLAQQLNGRLDKCRPHTEPTTTEVETHLVEGTKNRTRNPTQDKCVAERGYSANLALSDVYPGHYTAADAKKRRVAEWLHRSAFSYGVEVKTEISYPGLVGWDANWIRDSRYTWLAPQLKYGYRTLQNNIQGTLQNSIPHVLVERDLYPLNRESCMLFQALLDKSLENTCWEWNCWGNDAVAMALIESTRVADDQEEAPSEEKIKEMVRQDLAQRPE
ncbi:hypothetical protein FNAPI_1206 [Fusarium napiforme]|uniref:Uncharacterized protein n=1 Tax=Fusarium napiforme TaxID=42672 RepID=A0A8H5NI52_9HYPO|nr:hypothetical protein FNAPI_1206 [Fusarium napiforme]